MALEGSLKDFGLADIFQLIYVQKKTGTLKMKNASKDIDQRRKKAPKGWNTEKIIRQMREARK